MTLAENKYKSHLLSGEWGNQYDKQAGIAALYVLKKELSDDKKNLDNKKKNKEDSTSRKDLNSGWKKKKPTGNQTSKEMDGKTYDWWPNHGKEWV